MTIDQPAEAPAVELTFPEYLQRVRGLALSTIAAYDTHVRGLIKAGNSIGWGDEETAEAAEARWVRHLGLAEVRPRNAAWNAWRSFAKESYDVAVPALEPQLDAVCYEGPLLEAAAIILEAAGIEASRRLRWVNVHIEHGMIAGKNNRESQRAYRYGRKKIAHALQVLRDHFEPTDGAQLVLPQDRAGTIQLSQATARKIRADGASFRRARLGGTDPRPSAPTLPGAAVMQPAKGTTPAKRHRASSAPPDTAGATAPKPHYSPPGGFPTAAHQAPTNADVPQGPVYTAENSTEQFDPDAVSVPAGSINMETDPAVQYEASVEFRRKQGSFWSEEAHRLVYGPDVPFPPDPADPSSSA